MDLSLLGAFSLVSLAVAISPGPSWAFVIASSLSSGMRGATAAILGNAAGIVCHALAVACGLTAILAYSSLAFDILKWIGALYLIWLGVRTIIRQPPANLVASQTDAQTETPIVTEVNDGGANSGTPTKPDSGTLADPVNRPLRNVRELETQRDWLRLFRTGLLVNVGNPKVAILMLTLLPQFTRPELGNVAWQLLGGGLVHALIASVVLAGLATTTIRTARVWTGAGKAAAAARWGAGLLLVGLGLKLAFSKLN